MQINRPLVRVVGTVTDLKTSNSSENFVFGSGDRVIGGAAAAGLAAAGLAGAATGAAMSSGDAADKVTAFECRVGTQRVKVLLETKALARADPQRIRAKNQDSRALAHGFTALARSFLMEKTFSPR